MHSYHHHGLGLRVVPVVVGDCFVSGDEEVVITTTLGSCIAVCLFDAVAALGGMNHFLLSGSADDRLSASSRYGGAAMEQLINGVLRHTGRRDRLRAKVFGGGAVNGLNSDVGQSNIAFVTAYLRDEDIEVLSWDVGGVQARSVRFFPTTGRSQRRLLGSAGLATVVREEKSFADKLQTTQIGGEVELF